MLGLSTHTIILANIAFVAPDSDQTMNYCVMTIQQCNRACKSRARNRGWGS